MGNSPSGDSGDGVLNSQNSTRSHTKKMRSSTKEMILMESSSESDDDDKRDSVSETEAPREEKKRPDSGNDAIIERMKTDERLKASRRCSPKLDGLKSTAAERMTKRGVSVTLPDHVVQHIYSFLLQCANPNCKILINEVPRCVTCMRVYIKNGRYHKVLCRPCSLGMKPIPSSVTKTLKYHLSSLDLCTMCERFVCLMCSNTCNGLDCETRCHECVADNTKADLRKCFHCSGHGCKHTYKHSSPSMIRCTACPKSAHRVCDKNHHSFVFCRTCTFVYCNSCYGDREQLECIECRTLVPPDEEDDAYRP